MDKLGRLIISEAAKMTTACNGEYYPADLDFIPDKELADWARNILRTLASDSKITFEPTGDPNTDICAQANMFGHLGKLLLQAPRAADCHVRTTRFGEEALLESIRLIISADDRRKNNYASQSSRGHPKSNSIRWGNLQMWSTAAAAIFEANGSSRRAASNKVAGILGKAGIEVSGDTIRRNWFAAQGDSTLLEDMTDGFSMPRALIDGWIEELLFDDRWLSHVVRGRSETEFCDFCVEMRQDLIGRYIPNLIGKACDAWISELRNLGEKGV